MSGRARVWVCMLAVLLLPALACRAVTGRSVTEEAPTLPPAVVLPTLTWTEPAPAAPAAVDDPAEAGSEPQPGEAYVSPITFCQDVTDAGQCIGPAAAFPAGTATVWAYFTFQNMPGGLGWSRVWFERGEIFFESGRETWEDGQDGWVAYSISGDPTLAGEYTLVMAFENELSQSASFTVSEAEAGAAGGPAFPAFGSIQFATEISEDNISLDPGTSFEAGVSQVYACFPYQALAAGQGWGYAWDFEGEVMAEEELAWSGEPGGLTYLWLESEDGLQPGAYTLRLYLDGQLARSAGFEVTEAAPPEPQPYTEDPEDLVDADLMPAYEMLRSSDMELLNRLASLVLDFQIEVRLVDSLESGVAVYSYQVDTCEIEEKGERQAGRVLVSQAYWDENTWEEVAAAIAHELTHAFQHLYTGYRCGGCSIQKEYEAFTVEIYALEEMDRMDLVEENWPGLADADGSIDQDLLWEAIASSYSECPEY